MIHDRRRSLTLLQHADSAFPSGGFSFSSGLETLAADGLLPGKRLARFLVEVVQNRWGTFDRVYLSRSFGAVDDSARSALDRDVETSTLCAEARRSSSRAGLALLGTWARLGMPAARRYRELVGQGLGHGHLPVAQGLVYVESGLDLASAELASCWSMLSGLVNASIRLGTIGPLAAQDVLNDVRDEVAAVLAEPLGEDAVPHAWTPLQDIALARHIRAELRLFAS